MPDEVETEYNAARADELVMRVAADFMGKLGTELGTRAPLCITIIDHHTASMNATPNYPAQEQYPSDGYVVQDCSTGEVSALARRCSSV